MASRGNYARLHFDIVNLAVAKQALMLDYISNAFDAPPEGTDWTKVVEQIRRVQNDPVEMARLNVTLRPLMEQLLTSMQQQPEQK